MKQKTKLVIMAVALAASTQAFSADIINNVTLGLTGGQTQISDSEYKKGNYGAFITNDTIINDSHHVLVDVGMQNSQKGKFEKDDDAKMKVSRVNAKVSYKYDFEVTEGLKLSPKAGIGFERIQFKYDDAEDKQTLKRTYAELGGQVSYDMGNSWGLSSTVAYEKDISTSNDWDKGDGYSIDFVGKKELDSRGVISFGPYFKSYKNDSEKLRDAGLKVSYSFQ